MKLRSALFESWRGRYSDSPRALSELMQVQRPDIRQYWVCNDPTGLPAGLRPVRRHSLAYFSRLMTSDLVVANDIISKHLVKGPRVTYVQTWHGTPLKTIGFDEERMAYSGAVAHRRRMVRDVAKWDLLVSPGPATSDVFRRAFHYSGEILECGYPRNDALVGPDAGQTRDRVRAQLGLTPDERVVLYAPTWRDDRKDATGHFIDPGALDLAELRRIVGPGTVVLVRMHAVVQARAIADNEGFAIDVSDYPDIADLYLAADVLVSDYSSAVYDFAVTRKPIILFAYDVERYQNDVRGLYFDYIDWAPGPVVRTTRELGHALTALATTGPGQPSQRYADFVARFCPNEDGGASQRLLDAVVKRIEGGHARQDGVKPTMRTSSWSYGSK